MVLTKVLRRVHPARGSEVQQEIMVCLMGMHLDKVLDFPVAAYSGHPGKLVGLVVPPHAMMVVAVRTTDKAPVVVHLADQNTRHLDEHPLGFADIRTCRSLVERHMSILVFCCTDLKGSVRVASEPEVARPESQCPGSAGHRQ